MPTPSELLNERPRRSIFANYAANESATHRPSPGAWPEAPPDGTGARLPEALARGSASPGGMASPSRDDETPAEARPSPIDVAVARTFLYRFLAQAFQEPEPEGWSWLASRETNGALNTALTALANRVNGSSLAQVCDHCARQLAQLDGDEFGCTYRTCFGHTVRGACPMNEIEYADIKADPLFQPHRLADLAAFFAAFGLELAPDAAERIDHISIELEFMSVLAAKEAHALKHRLDDESVDVLRDAQKKFLREHLGRWSPAFARRLARMADGTAFGALASLLGQSIHLDCARLAVPVGSEDLLLRPIDDATERLCESCGISNLLPGTATVEPKS